MEEERLAEHGVIKVVARTPIAALDRRIPWQTLGGLSVAPFSAYPVRDRRDFLSTPTKSCRRRVPVLTSVPTVKACLFESILKKTLKHRFNPLKP